MRRRIWKGQWNYLKKKTFCFPSGNRVRGDTCLPSCGKIKSPEQKQKASRRIGHVLFRSSSFVRSKSRTDGRSMKKPTNNTRGAWKHFDTSTRPNTRRKMRLVGVWQKAFRTYGRTDAPSYRDATAHLKKKRRNWPTNGRTDRPSYINCIWVTVISEAWKSWKKMGQQDLVL